MKIPNHLLKFKQNKRRSVTAITLYKNKVVAVGYNTYTKTHPIQKHFASQTNEPYKEYLHAEIAAIIRSRSPIDTIMVFRHLKNGELGNAKPCPICQLAIKQAGIKKVIHS